MTTLATIPLFEGLDAAEIARLDRGSAWLRRDPGQWLVAHRDTGTDVYLVTDGSVRVVIFGQSREVILADLGPGAVFGEMSAIDGGPRSASVVALSAVTVARTPAALFLDVVHRHPAVCDGMLRLLVARVRRLNERVHEFANYAVPQRVRAELLRMADPDAAGPGEALVTPEVTHADLAARIGTHREAVTRELNALARAGIIRKARGRIVIVDAIRLTASLDEDAAD